jgi:predicted RNA-binding Zn-ribbon protein involved in translation (DUF1610 family)
MSCSTSTSYVVYDLRSYFAKQPGNLRLCPNCGKNISVSTLSPSKVVTRSLGGATIPCHEFSVLYKCEACSWWAIRESWGDREWSDGPDYLVVEQENPTERRSSQVQPWEQILEDLNLYKHTRPLPENLGKLFIGGVSYSRLERVRKSLWNDVKEFVINYAKSRTQKK